MKFSFWYRFTFQQWQRQRQRERDSDSDSFWDSGHWTLSDWTFVMKICIRARCLMTRPLGALGCFRGLWLSLGVICLVGCGLGLCGKWDVCKMTCQIAWRQSLGQRNCPDYRQHLLICIRVSWALVLRLIVPFHQINFASRQICSFN